METSPVGNCLRCLAKRIVIQMGSTPRLSKKTFIAVRSPVSCLDMLVHGQINQDRLADRKKHSELMRPNVRLPKLWPRKVKKTPNL